MPNSYVIAIALVLGSGCVGEIGDMASSPGSIDGTGGGTGRTALNGTGGRDRSEDAAVAIPSNPGETEAPNLALDIGFKRLTEGQYNHTLADLHGAVWQAACDKTNCDTPRPADDWFTRFTTQNYGYWREYQTGYPNDAQKAGPGQPRGGYRRLDQVVYGEHLAYWFGSTMEIAGGDYENWVGDRVIFEPCRNDNENGVTDFATNEEVYEHCMDAFITEFGMRAFRRPLSAEEHATFMEIYAEVGSLYASENLTGSALAARGLRNVMAVITSSPEFLYRVELGDDEGNLTPYELASRLSYHFWDTMPDDALFDAAADGSLMTGAGYQAQVDRLFANPRSRQVIDGFYRDFFRVQDIPDIDVQDGPSSYHGGPDYNQYGNGLGRIRAAMQDEMANLGLWYTSTEPGTYEAMFRSTLHFLECQPPAHAPEQCYGAGPYSQWSYDFEGACDADDCAGGGWDGASPPVQLPESERVGLLTRLAVLGHDTVNARPIRRGLYIREALLCNPIPPPENCDVVKPPELDVHMTVREKVEAITERTGTTCLGCHGALINGFGHALSHFSSKGQYWETEHMFTDQQNSEGEYWFFLAEPSEWANIDARGTTTFNGGTVSIDGAQELTDLLVESGQLEGCWSREYFRFALGRIETAEDTSAIEVLAAQLRAGATLAEGFKAIAYIPQFQSLQKPVEGERVAR